MKKNKYIFPGLVLALLLLAIYWFWDVALTVLAAMIIAYLLNPLARFFARKLKIRHSVATALVIILVSLLIITLISLAIPSIVNQITAIATDITGDAGNYEQIVHSLTGKMANMGIPETMVSTVINLLMQGEDYITGFLTSIAAWIVSFSLGILDAIILVVLLVYFMVDSEKIKAGVFSLLPDSLIPVTERICAKSNTLTKKYIKSRVLMSMGMSIVIYIGLSIIGLPNAAIFALMSFVFDFVPYFGSIIAGAIEAFYALITGGVSMAIVVLIFVLVVQQLEGNVVAPRVEGNATGIHPVIVIVSLLCCNQIFGPIGMLISTPIAAIIKTVGGEFRAYLAE